MVLTISLVEHAPSILHGSHSPVVGTTGAIPRGIRQHEMVEMRIIHVSSDEKFIDLALRQFEEILPRQNECFVISKRSVLRHVKNPVAKCVSPFRAAWGSLRTVLCQADLIVLHSLTTKIWKACRWTPPGKAMLWLGFGFDYYDLIHAAGEGIGPLTAASSLHSRSGLRKAIHAWKKSQWRRMKKAALQRVTHFAPVIPPEFAMVRTANPDFSAAFASWSYGSVEDLGGEHPAELTVNANDILVGNSAAISNNHLEAIQLLADNPYWGARRVVMPLSYGGENHREKIIAQGMSQLGSRFLPILEFMPANEYTAVLASCRTVLFNHMRQQAVGNLIVLLRQGSTVFINEVSPVFAYLLEEGFIVFPISELMERPVMINHHLSGEEMRKNRDNIQRIWGREVVRKKNAAMLNGLLPGSVPRG